MPDPNPPVDLSRYDFGVYDPPMSEQTPIPADDPTEAAIAAVVKALSRFEQPPYGDLQCSATMPSDLIPEAAEVIDAAREWRRVHANRSVTAVPAQVRASRVLAEAVNAYNWRIAEHGADR